MSCPACAGYVGVACPCCGGTARTCPDCGGTGHRGFYAFSIDGRVEVAVKEHVYYMLPDTEDQAEAMGWRYCKADLEPCSACDGTGEV